jgi:hypothetical protein
MLNLVQNNFEVFFFEEDIFVKVIVSLFKSLPRSVCCVNIFSAFHSFYAFNNINLFWKYHPFCLDNCEIGSTVCHKLPGPVCGTDGKNHPNEDCLETYSQQCKGGKIKMKHTGPCKKGKYFLK